MRTGRDNPLSIYASTTICVLVGALHYVLTTVARQFEAVFEGFGAELPVLTRFLLADSIYYWIVPSLVAIVVVSHHFGRVSRSMTLLVTSISNIASIILCTLGMYLPIFQLGAVAGT